MIDLFLSQYSECDEYNGLDETVSRRRVRRESQSYLEDYVDSLKYQIDKLRLQIDDLELWTRIYLVISNFVWFVSFNLVENL